MLDPKDKRTRADMDAEIILLQITCDALRKEASDQAEALKFIPKLHDEFFAMMAAFLSEFPCCCEPGAHSSTPPMMWPELIACIVRRARQDGQSEIKDVAPSADNKLAFASDMIRAIPESWRDAEIKICNSLGRIEVVRRISLCRNREGRKIVMFHDTEFTTQ